MAVENVGGARRTSCDLYLAKVSELLNFPALKKETSWRRRGATRRAGLTEERGEEREKKELVL